MRLVDDLSYYHFILWKRNGFIAHYHMMFLSFELLEQDYDYILCLKFDAPLHTFNPDIAGLTKQLQNIFNNYQRTFVLLTLRKEAPLHMVRTDEFIYSFSCRFHHFKNMICRHRPGKLTPKNLLFELTDDIVNGSTRLNNILVRQIPFMEEEQPSIDPCDVIIPHKGKIRYLHNLMPFLSRIKNINVYIGIDQAPVGHDVDFRYGYPNFLFYNFKPNPVGPYVIRNWLTGQGKARNICFQDSDDIPCADRFDRLISFIDKSGITLCGSHEVKLNYIDRTVQAIRYPKDVKSALQHGPGHALLHPSSAIARQSFYDCQTLSEDRIFANDTKFLYYCYFKLSAIANIDEFLYIRRSHSSSLTTSAKTSLSSQKRAHLMDQWVVDFTLVKLGFLKLEDSCLKFERRKDYFSVKRLL